MTHNRKSKKIILNFWTEKNSRTRGKMYCGSNEQICPVENLNFEGKEKHSTCIHVETKQNQIPLNRLAWPRSSPVQK